MGTGKLRYGRCRAIFLLAVAFDLLGLALILTGIFDNLQLKGRSFGEFLIYSGGIVIFFSLLFWLAWYSGNLEVSLEELERDMAVDKRKSFKQLARKLSERFSKRRRRKISCSAGEKDLGLEAGAVQTATPNLPGEPLYCHPSVYINNAISPQLESPSYLVEEGSARHLELSTLSKLDNELVIFPQDQGDRLV